MTREEDLKGPGIFIVLFKKEQAQVVWHQVGKPGPIRGSWGETDFDPI